MSGKSSSDIRLEVYRAQYGARSSVERNGGPQQKRPQKGLARFYSSGTDMAYLALRGGHSLLDVGCCDGALGLRAAAKYKSVSGVDIVPELVEVARRRTQAAGAAGEFYAVDIETQPLPFPDDYFDTVTSIAVLTGIFDPYRAVREMSRVLRHGGQLVVSVANTAYLRHRLTLLTGHFPRLSTHAGGWDGGLVSYFTKPSLSKMLIDCGFRIRRTAAGCGMFAGPRSCWPSLLSGALLVDCEKVG